MTGLAVDDHGDYDDIAEGDGCTSKILKGGEEATLNTVSAQWTAEVESGVSDGNGECWFIFRFEGVVDQPSYTLKLAGQKDLEVTPDMVENGIRLDLEPSRSKAELAYAKADDADLSDPDDVELSIEQGHERCNDMSELKGRELVAYIIEENQLGELSKPIKYLCPKHRDALTKARRGFYDGKYAVGKGVRPGTYRTVGPTSDCYWERSTKGGAIVANGFVNNAQSGVRVTIRSTDGGFSSEGCGAWLRQ